MTPPTCGWRRRRRSSALSAVPARFPFLADRRDDLRLRILHANRRYAELVALSAARPKLDLDGRVLRLDGLMKTGNSRLAVEEFLSGRVDRVYLVYTDFQNMVKQVPTIKQLLPLELGASEDRVVRFDTTKTAPATYIYEPGEAEILDEIVPRFTALQVYQAILESLASEHAARMVAMKNATDSATELASALQLEYNKARQQGITSEILDIVGGAEALA